MRYTQKLVKWCRYVLTAVVLVSCLILTPITVHGAEPNPSYKEWCIKTFNRGEEIYKAYSVVSALKYKSDSSSSIIFDYWQTPTETLVLGTGDCEDSVLLFSSLISECNRDVRLVWGFVYEKETGNKAMHVWVELTAYNKEVYYMNAYTNDWEGLVKKKVIEETLMLDPILELTQCTYNEILHVLAQVDEYNMEAYELIFKYFSEYRQEFEMSGGVYNIFGNLHGMVNREPAFAEGK